MWLVLIVILSLMMVAGIVMLCQVVMASHSKRDLTTAIPVSTVGVVGMLNIVDHIMILVYGVYYPADSAYRSLIQDSPTNVNIIILVLLWRSVSRSAMPTVHMLYVFIFFAMTAIGVASVNTVLSRDQTIIANVSSLHPEVFRGAPMRSYVVRLCMEYIAFYIPSFYLIASLWNTRSVNIPEDTVGEKGYTARLPATKTDCAKCANLSPFLDYLNLAVAVIVLVVRPLFILYYWVTFRVIADLPSDYVIFPAYLAMCMVSMQFGKSRTSLSLQPSPPIAVRLQKCVLDMGCQEKHVHWSS